VSVRRLLNNNILRIMNKSLLLHLGFGDLGRMRLFGELMQELSFETLLMIRNTSLLIGFTKEVVVDGD
jgi:hypothetical protein